MCAKLGLFEPSSDDDTLVRELLQWMARSKADFTYTFYTLGLPAGPESLANADPSLAPWLSRWRARLDRQQRPVEAWTSLMWQNNPVAIARNHEVERALSPAEQGDLAPLERLLTALHDPFDYTQPRSWLSDPPQAPDMPYRTFCGT
jgi:uncharacterized protein YdiU (UPF0061 family)